MKKYSVTVTVDGSFDTLDQAEEFALVLADEHGHLSATVAEVVCTYERQSMTRRKLPDEPEPEKPARAPKKPARKRKPR